MVFGKRRAVGIVGALALVAALMGCPQTPTVDKVDISLSAQYLAVVSDTLCYVTVADYSSPDKNGVYSFNPSAPSEGYTAVAVSSSYYPQDVVVGSDGYVYVANYASMYTYDAADDGVLKIDPATDQVVATIATTTSDPVGLLAGTYNGHAGIFVAEGGGYDASWNSLDGAVDFIPTGASTVTPVASGLPASRLAAFSADSSKLLLTGGYPSETHILDISGTTVTPTHLLDSSAEFGSSDAEVTADYGYAYVAAGANTIYKVSAAGAVTSFTVGTSGDHVTNLGRSGTVLYAVDTTSGHVFAIDDDSAPPSLPLTTTEAVAGEIRFAAGKAFVAVGNYNNTPGVYYFDLSSSTPAAYRVGE